MSKKNIIEEDKFNLKRIHTSYSVNIKCSEGFIKSFAPGVKEVDKKLIKKNKDIYSGINDILKSFQDEIIKDNKDKKVKIFKIPKKEIIDKLISIVNPLIKIRYLPLLFKSFFIMLISYLDFLFSDLIHCYYQNYPEGLPKDKSITLKELKMVNDINEAIEIVIGKEVDNFLRDSFNNKIKYLRDLGININEDYFPKDIINEAVARRNLIVHNNSIVNKFYLESLPKNSYWLKIFSEGDKIEIDEKYYSIISDNLFLAGIILIQSCLRKWKRDCIEEADKLLIYDIYEMLLKEKYDIAEKFGLYSKTIETYDRRGRLYLNINYCQALKWQNKTSELEEELKNKDFDISSSRPKYVVAISALKDDKDTFYKHLKNAIEVDEMAII